MEIKNPSILQKSVGNFPTQDLTITVNSNLIPFFYPLLGQGFLVKTSTESSIKELICNQLGISEEYLEERIQTIFLNGTVVDDLNSSINKNGSTLALSGAMPGLVGATLRRGGFYASFRSQISYNEHQFSVEEENLWVVIKLFNLIVREVGSAFLEKGIWTEGEKLQKFLTRNLEELKMHGSLGELNGKPFKLDRIQKVDWETHLIFLQVNSQEVV